MNAHTTRIADEPHRPNKRASGIGATPSSKEAAVSPAPLSPPQGSPSLPPTRITTIQEFQAQMTRASRQVDEKQLEAKLRAAKRSDAKKPSARPSSLRGAANHQANSRDNRQSKQPNSACTQRNCRRRTHRIWSGRNKKCFIC